VYRSAVRLHGLVCAGLIVLLGGRTASGQVRYGDEGLEWRSRNDGFSAVVGWRNQVRFTTPFPRVPVDAGDISDGRRDDFRLNRSRLKLQGHLFSRALTYKAQADFVEERLRDLNLQWTAREWLRVRAGWWKIEHLLERMQSSGSQQLVDRSILDRWFTLGRQVGLQVNGRVGGARHLGGTYYLGAFRNVDVDVKGGATLPVWLARYEWTFAGREVDLAQGDPDRSRDLLLKIGTSAVRTEGAHAFYSGSGLGVSLPLRGLAVAGEGGPARHDRFRTRQYAGDAAMKWRGVSLQGELHRKDVRVTATGQEQALVGAYAMAGVLASTIWSRAPDALEFTARLAVVDPSRTDDEHHQHERVAGATWYVNGHRNKISVDVSQLRFTIPTAVVETDVRTRLQWEITF
jgi:phosphate-selective porin OprO and OprP